MGEETAEVSVDGAFYRARAKRPALEEPSAKRPKLEPCAASAAAAERC